MDSPTTTPVSDHTPSTAAGPPPTLPGWSAFMTLGAALLVTSLQVCAALLVTVRRGDLRDWMEGPDPVNATVTVADVLIGLHGLSFVVAFLATGHWLLGVRTIADWAAPAHPQRRARWWAVAGWIVPFVNLWFPYQVVADSSRALRSRVTNFWPWWIAWLLLGAGAIFDRSGGRFETVADLDGWILAQQVDALLLVVTCVLWWRIVRAATAAAREASAATSP